MLIEHRGASPRVPDSAFVAPTAEKAMFGESRAEAGMETYLDVFAAHRDDRPVGTSG